VAVHGQVLAVHLVQHDRRRVRAALQHGGVHLIDVCQFQSKITTVSSTP
jgi:hypothetical protein